MVGEKWKVLILKFWKCNLLKVGMLKVLLWSDSLNDKEVDVVFEEIKRLVIFEEVN